MGFIIPTLISIALGIFSTTVMSYISMATPIGPWIAPTLVLCGLILFRIFGHVHNTKTVSLTTASGSVGGILATACGFSFPTLYFVDPMTFNSWMATPWYFAAVLGSLSLAAGLLGILIANVCEQSLIVEQHYEFPIGQLVYKMIAASNQTRKTVQLILGIVSATVFSIAQDGLVFFRGFIPHSITLVSAHAFSIFSIPQLKLDLWPFFWAIGFVTGHVIAIPLFVGAISKIFILDSLNKLFFPIISNTDFVLAFGSGMVLSGAIMSFMVSPRKIRKTFSQFKNSFSMNNTLLSVASKSLLIEGLLVFAVVCTFLTYFKFSLLNQVYLIIGTVICTYQIVVIAGKMGLAPLGRFATFIMVPGMLIFPLSMTQIVIIATFVEVSGGVAADILFGRKMAHLGAISLAQMRRYQYLGLLVSAASVGIIFWLLINHFTLGSEQLFAQRAQARQLLISVQEFNYIVLGLGFLFGFVLKFMRLNPLLVLGGLLMPLNITIGLVIGGMATLLVKDKEEYFPFWSGVFAANSLWMVFQALR